MRVREGWLITARADGHTGYGDCAPMPEAGTETPALAEQRLAFWADAASRMRSGDSLERLLDRLDAASAQTDVPRAPTQDAPPRAAAPAADCAVETALLDLSARIAGVTLRSLLAPQPAPAIAVNAVLGSAGALTQARLDDALADGYRTLKLKVGTARSDLGSDPELERLERFAAALPAGAALRLDANGAWSPAAARRIVERLQALPIESLEEPLRCPDDTALAVLQRLAPFALALDESLHGRAGPIDPARLPVRRLVLKPGAVGGLRATHRLAERAIAAGREVVVTSLIESAAGLWATAQLAAAIDTPLAHGLATAAWLAEDLGPSPRPESGRILLPDTPGSGFVAEDRDLRQRV
ncbi:MAG: o-succinylbenzoate synthase [Thiohalocapsa sp.]|nr:o-succinylbenzoate synthase [Thiohalocapsa sp.]